MKNDIISLFSGMETGYLAMKNKGINFGNFYSSEIKPFAINLSKHNFPDIIQVGSILDWKEWDIDWKNIGFIFSGSPCQDLSISGKRAGINGSKSSLFWIFIEILNHVKKLNPNVLFLQENVGSAHKLDIGIMSRAMGLYPCRLNSSLVVAQLRDRYYWTNIRTKKDGMFGDIITDIPPPKDRKIMFNDIIENGYVDRDKALAILESEGDSNHYKDYNSDKFQKYAKKRAEKSHLNIVYIENNEVRVKTNTIKGYDLMTEKDCLNLAFPKSETRRARVTKGKSPCLLEGNEPLYVLFKDNDDYKIRLLSKVELLRLQGFPDDFCEIMTRRQTGSLVGDGWTLPMIEHIISFINIELWLK